MLVNTRPCKAILLSSIAFLSFLGCNKPENETPSSLMKPTNPMNGLINSDISAKSGRIASTTGFPMIDLGALVDPWPFCAYGVNNLGKVVGHVGVQSGFPHAFLWSRQDGVKDLGTLGEQSLWSMANEINDRGQVVGSSWAPGTTGQRAFLWSKNGGMVNLGITVDQDDPSDPYSMGFGISNQGEIVGMTGNYAFLWTDKLGMVLLSTPRPLTYSVARDINDYGRIVGNCMVYCCPSIYHAVLWKDVGEMLDLGTLKVNSMALGINNLGEVVGGSSDREGWSGERIGSFWDNNIAWVLFDHFCVAFIWTDKLGMSQLPMLVGGDASSAHAINDRGQVVGWSYTAAGEVHAFLWTSKNGIKDLGTLPGDIESVAYGINNLGQVVGYSMKMQEDGNRAIRHAVIWTVK